ncbi:MAG: short-chain dehydrogenase/reductase, partial [Alphaproteobacteria bacterium]|nr:short-chain dehydrogenase/reductase [Alphaproteobacteria bacterium]
MAKSTKVVAKKQQRIQQQVAKADQRQKAKKKSKSGEQEAMQAGAREYPAPPFPRQHQPKPGDERKLEPPPMYDAPFYLGSGKLEGMAALITGGDSGIGRAVAVLFAREGCDVAIAHLAEDRDAEITAEAVEAEGRRCLILKGDVKERDFCRQAVADTAAEFGRLDVLVNNAAFQVHVPRLEDLTPEHFDETLKTNLY